MTLQTILQLTCDAFEFPIEKIQSKSRKRVYVECRVAYAYLARNRKYKLREISAEINRKHNNINHYYSYDLDSLNVYPNSILSTLIKILETKIKNQK